MRSDDHIIYEKYSNHFEGYMSGDPSAPSPTGDFDPFKFQDQLDDMNAEDIDTLLGALAAWMSSKGREIKAESGDEAMLRAARGISIAATEWHKRLKN